MRSSILIVLGCLALAVLPASGQQKTTAPYRIHFDSSRDMELLDRDPKTGVKGVFLKVVFVVTVEEAGVGEPDANYKVAIEEEGKRVKEVDLPRPTLSEELDIVLAVDTSGSMKEHGRMAQARAAAATFLDKLPAKADCGLVFFDHELRPPILSPTKERTGLKQQISTIEPRGGTAYRDAAIKAIEMLSRGPKSRDRALVLMTDGLDLNSVKDKQAVIAQAKQHNVRIYTVGIGEPGKMEIVSSVLVLDHSGSMSPPADEQDKISKISALHRAAARFVDIMPESARTTLIPFSTGVGTPDELSNRKSRLKSNIEKLAPGGETALFDACYAAVATLEADGAKGRRVVVAMTDGIDNSSRRRKEEVIERAREAKIPLYLLGFGREGELDAATMEEMANSTGGKYYHARNEKALMDIFENLSIKIHDDGINEEELTELAKKTGGEYYPAKNIAELKFILEKVTQVIQRERREIVFPSLRQVHDGLPRHVALKLVSRSGQVVSDQVGEPGASGKEKVISTDTGRVGVGGVVIAETNNLTYLFFLAGIGVLIFLPSLFRRGAGTMR